MLTNHTCRVCLVLCHSRLRPGQMIVRLVLMCSALVAVADILMQHQRIEPPRLPGRAA